MTAPQTITHNPKSFPVRQRILMKLVVAGARLLAKQSPNRIQSILSKIRRGSSPASYQTAYAVRYALVSSSYHCTGPKNCLPRSLAVVLMCRLRGVWPTWCVGVRAVPPFGAHSWVEADGKPVDEPYPPEYHRVILSVPPLGDV